MKLRDAHIAIVGRGGADSRDYARILATAGATSRHVHVGEVALEIGEDVDAIVLDAGNEVESFVACASELGAGARPVVVVVSPDTTARRLAPLGSVALFEQGGTDDAFVDLLSALFVDSRTSLQARLTDAEDKSRMLGGRLAGAVRDAQAMAHDARVLCGVAMGYAANVRDGFAGPVSPAQLDHLAQITSAVGDVGSLLERFTSSMRALADVDDAPPASRRLTRRRMHCDLRELVTSVVRLFDHVARDKRIALSLEAAEPVRIWCDPIQIKQLVTNLIVNAVKFTPGGGKVSVGVALEDLDASVGGPTARRHAEIHVRDNGPGVPAEDRVRVFERGYRVALHAHIEGTGLGLAVVRDVAMLHAGTVRVEETPGGGATFVVSLPVDLRRRREE